MRIVAVALVAGFLLAGCTGTSDNAGRDGPVTTIHGLVIDPAKAPVPGAMVHLGGTTRQTVTDEDGRFTFIDPGDDATHHVINVRADGFLPASYVTEQQNVPGVQFQAEIQLQFAPPDEPYSVPLPFDGIITCSVLAAVGHNHGGDAHQDQDTDCSLGASSDNVFEFDVEPGIANVVIEVVWESDTPAADYLSMTITGVEVANGQDQQFFFVEGTSPLRGTVARLQSQVFYEADGGTVRVSVQIAGPESDVVASAAVNQQFRIIATMFYVQPGPSSYSALDN